MPGVLHSRRGILARFLVIAAASLALTTAAARAQNDCLCFLDFPENYPIVSIWEAWLDTCGLGFGATPCIEICDQLPINFADKILWGHGPWAAVFPAGSLVLDTGRSYSISDIDSSFVELRSALRSVEERFGRMRFTRNNATDPETRIWFDSLLHCRTMDTVLSTIPFQQYTGRVLRLLYYADAPDDANDPTPVPYVSLYSDRIVVRDVKGHGIVRWSIVNVLGSVIARGEFEPGDEFSIPTTGLAAGYHAVIIENGTVVPFIIVR
jgi:hypothetical protein